MSHMDEQLPLINVNKSVSKSKSKSKLHFPKSFSQLSIEKRALESKIVDLNQILQLEILRKKQLERMLESFLSS